MFVSKASTGLFINAWWKAENVAAIRVVGCSQNTSQLKELYLVHKRLKGTKDPCVEKKRCSEKPKKSRTFFKLATAAVVGTTVAVIAVKHDDEFRDWAKENVPVLDELVKIIFQEEETYLQSLDRAHKNLSAWLKKSLNDLFNSTKRSKPGASSKPSDMIGALPPSEPCEESRKLYKLPESAFVLKSGDDKKENPLKVLKDLEEKMGLAAQASIQNMHSTGCAVRDYARLIDYLDQIIATNNENAFDKIRKKKMDIDKGHEKAEQNSINLKSLQLQLSNKLKENTSISNDIITKAENYMQNITKDVTDAAAKLEKTIEDSRLTKQSFDKVKQARLHFSAELEILVPNIWLYDANLNVNPDQVSPFIEGVLKDLDYYGREDAKNKTIFLTGITAAAEKYKTKGADSLEDFAKVLIPYEVNKIKREHQKELDGNLLAHKAKCDKNAKELSKQTKEVYADLTAEALRIKEKEVERKMQQMYEEKLAAARDKYKLALAKMIARMNGANEAISKRGEKDVNEQKRQQFWSAAQSFMSAVKPIGTTHTQEPKPLRNEIANLEKVKPEGDALVDSVINSIPEEAKERGIPSESTLQQRFNKVMSSARGWAGVPPGEVTLLQLLLARFQSLLYLDTGIPQPELDNEPAIDLKKLNNYDLLNRAQYYVDRGDFDQAIRYLNLLRGPSGKVASGWVKDALVYLETRQAAEVLLAQATAAGM